MVNLPLFRGPGARKSFLFVIVFHGGSITETACRTLNRAQSVTKTSHDLMRHTTCVQTSCFSQKFTFTQHVHGCIRKNVHACYWGHKEQEDPSSYQGCLCYTPHKKYLLFHHACDIAACSDNFAASFAFLGH